MGKLTLGGVSSAKSANEVKLTKKLADQEQAFLASTDVFEKAL